jgi:hypothetical protein
MPCGSHLLPTPLVQRADHSQDSQQAALAVLVRHSRASQCQVLAWKHGQPLRAEGHMYSICLCSCGFSPVPAHSSVSVKSLLCLHNCKAVLKLLARQGVKGGVSRNIEGTMTVFSKFSTAAEFQAKESCWTQAQGTRLPS